MPVAVATVSVSALKASEELSEPDITATNASWAPAVIVPLLESGPLLWR
jgi:hypothetical protein